MKDKKLENKVLWIVLSSLIMILASLVFILFNGNLLFDLLSVYKNEFYIRIKDILETIYFLAGILMLITVFIALNQLSTLKHDITSREDRASAEKALEILKDFFSNIIPEVQKYNNDLSQSSVNFTTKDKYFSESFVVDINSLDLQALTELKEKTQLGVRYILEELEVISVSLIHGVANDDIVYNAISEIFCDFVESEHLIISISRAEKVPFTHIIEVYDKWMKKKNNKN